MVFSDLLFIFVFIPLFIIFYIVANYADKFRVRKYQLNGVEIKKPLLFRNFILILFSILFYSWGEPVYIFLMLFAVVVNYFSGLLISYKKPGAWQKIWLIIGVGINLIILGSFKYLGFFASILSEIGIGIEVPEIPLPIGISFYIFQSITYLVDVYRKESPEQKNIFDLLLYIAMFPQLIAGPIVRYGNVAEEINHREVSVSDISDGSYRFFIGFGKKVIFANIFGEIATQLIGGNLDSLTALGAWVGIIAFTLQIYFDFSGYSDMAIGLGRSVGFHFPENFNNPYISTSMTDFWRRWYMSLGSFFRDYVYIPMGGNRRHQALNIMTVWFLTGMWHGASWNFIIWGLYFGLIIMIEKYTILKWKIPRVFSHIYSLFLIIVGWGIFYFDDFGKLKQFYKVFFDFGSINSLPLDVRSLILDNFWLWIFAILFCLPIKSFYKEKIQKIKPVARLQNNYTLYLTRAFISITILVISVVLLVGATNNAFIYTRF